MTDFSFRLDVAGPKAPDPGKADPRPPLHPPTGPDYPEHEDRPPTPDEEQTGIKPGKIPTNDPHDPRFPGSQPDLA